MNSILEKTTKLDKIWDLKEEDNVLYNFVLHSYPELRRALETLQERCPVAHTCGIFSENDFFRLKGHARSFCMKVGKGVLVFKGSEPFSNDYLTFYEQTYLNPINETAKFDGFAMLGHEIYLAMTRKAAMNCTETTKNFVKDYQVKINRLPHVPIPLSVFTIPDFITNTFIDRISKYLSKRSQFSIYDYINTLAKDGLAIYMFYYDGHPLRAAHAMNYFPFAIGGDDSIWKQNDNLNIFNQNDIQKIIHNWVVLVTNMLGVGYVPTAWLHTGNCLQIQNLVMDGGMYAIDSIIPINRLKFDQDIARAIYISIKTLAKSISVLTSIHLEIAFTALWHELSKQIKLNPYKLNYDPRIFKLFDKDGMGIIV